MLSSKPMWAWRIPRWALPAALGGVLAIAGADAILMQRHPVSVRPRAMAEKIGLRADAEGEGMRVQWSCGSRPVRNADHAVLFIEDGATRSQLDLTGRQLDSSSVKYWRFIAAARAAANRLPSGCRKTTSGAGKRDRREPSYSSHALRRSSMWSRRS